MNIELIDQKETPVLYLRTFSPVEALPALIGEGYGKIMARMGEVGEQPMDAPYTAYYNLDMQNLDVELGFPVSKMYEAKGDILCRALPAGKAVVSLYKGAYSGMHPIYNAMFAFMAEHKLEAAGPYFEYYLNGPGDVASEDELLTRIVMPVKEIGA